MGHGDRQVHLVGWLKWSIASLRWCHTCWRPGSSSVLLEYLTILTFASGGARGYALHFAVLLGITGNVWDELVEPGNELNYAWACSLQACMVRGGSSHCAWLMGVWSSSRFGMFPGGLLDTTGLTPVGGALPCVNPARRGLLLGRCATSPHWSCPGPLSWLPSLHHMRSMPPRQL